MDVLPNITTTVLPLINVQTLNENLQRFSWIDYLVFILMLLICIAIGIYFGFYDVAKTEVDYLIGGRNMKAFPVGLSLVASFISGIALLGTPTEIYVYGLQYIYIVFGIIIMAVIFQTVFLPVFMELQLTSTFEYLERRFDWSVRIFGSLLCIIGMSTWLPIVIYVPALAFNQVTGINIHYVTPIVSLICIFYTSLGGLKAVVWTDVIQSIVMVGTMIIIAVKGTIDIGGIDIVFQRNYDSGRLEAPNFDPNPYTRHTFWTLVIGGTFYYLQVSQVNQSMIQRYLALPNFKEGIKAIWIFVVLLIFLVSISCYCGLLTYATYYNCDPVTTGLAKQKDQILPVLVMDVVGNIPGVTGLFVAGIFSAALSSLSTGLNSLVAVLLEDFYRPFFKTELSERHKQIMMKSTTVILGLIFVGLVFVVEKLGTVLQVNMSIGTISAGPSLAIFTMGLLLPWVNAKGALFGGIGGLIVMGWLILSTQFAIGSGHIKFDTKPVSVKGCTYNFTSPVSQSYRLTHYNSTESFHPSNARILTTSVNYPKDNDVLGILHLSYLWYTLIGTIVSCVLGLIVSFLGIGGGCLDPRDIDPTLLSTVIKNRIKPRSFPNQPPAQDPIILAYNQKESKISSVSEGVDNAGYQSYKNITSDL